jgi:hypothetical protein
MHDLPVQYNNTNKEKTEWIINVNMYVYMRVNNYLKQNTRGVCLWEAFIILSAAGLWMEFLQNTNK